MPLPSLWWLPAILGIRWLIRVSFRFLTLLSHGLLVSCFLFLYGYRLLDLEPILIHCDLFTSQHSPEKQNQYINIEKKIYYKELADMIMESDKF